MLHTSHHRNEFSSLSASTSPSDRVVIVLDLDKTVIDDESRLNLLLLSIIKKYGARCLVVIFSSYDLFFRLEQSIKNNYIRLNVIRRIKRYGIPIDGVVLSASPYEETVETFGCYYKQTIIPIEQVAKAIALKNNCLFSRGELLRQAGYSNVADQELDRINKAIIQPLGEIEAWREPAYQGGKQHMLIHTVRAYQRKGHTRFMVLDDKPEVMAVVERAKQEKIFGPDIQLWGLQVNIGHDSAERYTQFFEGCFQGITAAPVSPRPCISQVHGYIDSMQDLTQLTQLSNQFFSQLMKLDQLHVTISDTAVKDKIVKTIPPEKCSLLNKLIWHTPVLSSGLNAEQRRVDEWASIADEVAAQGIEARWEPIFLALPSPEQLTILQYECLDDPRWTTILDAYGYLGKVLNSLEKAKNTPSSWQTHLPDFFHQVPSASKRLTYYVNLLKQPQPIIQSLIVCYAWLIGEEEKKLKNIVNVALHQPIDQTQDLLDIKALLRRLTPYYPELSHESIEVCAQKISKQIKSKETRALAFDWNILWNPRPRESSSSLLVATASSSAMKK